MHKRTSRQCSAKTTAYANFHSSNSLLVPCLPRISTFDCGLILFDAVFAAGNFQAREVLNEKRQSRFGYRKSVSSSRITSHSHDLSECKCLFSAYRTNSRTYLLIRMIPGRCTCSLSLEHLLATTAVDDDDVDVFRRDMQTKKKQTRWKSANIYSFIRR